MLALGCRGSSKISRFITQSTEGKEANFDWREWEDMDFIFWKFSLHSNLEVKKTWKLTYTENFFCKFCSLEIHMLSLFKLATWSKQLCYNNLF